MDLSRRRKEIDVIDAEIVKNLAKRLKIARKIIRYKIDNNIEVCDLCREMQIIKTVRKTARQNDINPDFVEEVFRKVIDESKQKG